MVSLFHEKRDAIRVRSIHLLSFSQLDDLENIREIGMARTLNISEEGILIELQSAIPLGSVLDLVLNVADECLQVKGEVTRSKLIDGKCRLAVKFTHISPDSYCKLNKYLDNNYPYTRYTHCFPPMWEHPPKLRAIPARGFLLHQ